MRYPREIRDSLEKLRVLPIVSESGQRLVLSDVADIRITERIAKLLGLDTDSGGGSGGGGVQVQINVAPPWEREPAPPPTIEGEAVED